MQSRGQPTLGTSAFRAKNPPFGAVFTYHLAKDISTLKKIRHATEKKLRKDSKDIPVPSHDKLQEEMREGEPTVLLVIRDKKGNPVFPRLES